MEEFKTNPENPFVLLGGNTLEIGMHNRISAINRVNYLVRQTLPDFDLQDKTTGYRYALDREMSKRFYQDKPDAKIDEEFCQNMAQVCIEFENRPVEPFVSKEELDNLAQPTKEPEPIIKEMWYKRLLRKLMRR